MTLASLLQGLRLAGPALALFLVLSAARGEEKAPPAPPDEGSALAASVPVQANALDPELMISTVNKVEARWWKRKAVAARGNAPGAREAARDLLEMLRAAGLSRVEPMAEACLFEGLRLRAEGRHGEAREAFRLARSLDPGNPRAAWLAAPAATEEEAKGAWAGSLRWGAVVGRLTEYWSAVADLTQAGYALIYALALTGLGLTGVLLLYYGKAIVFEIGERLPQDMHPAWRQSLGWIGLLSPVLFVFLGLWAFVTWAVALIPFAQPAERRALAAWLALLALAVPAALALEKWVSFSGSPTARVALGAARHSLRPDMLEELNLLARENPHEPLFQALLARLIITRHPDRSLQLLRGAVNLAPEEGRYRILLGNVYFRQGKLEPAAVEYRAALDQDGRDPVAYFNLARAKMGIFDFAAGEELMQKAREFARHRIEEFEKSVPAGEVADPAFGVGEVASRLGRLEKPRVGVDSLMNPLTLGAAAALLLASFLGLRSRGLRAVRCPRCGEGFWPVNPGIPAEYPLCPACDQVLARKEGLDPSARAGQLGRIDRHLRRTSRERQILHFVWPGMSWVHEGRTWSGLLFAAAWVFLLQGALWPDRWIPLVTTTPLWPPGLPWQAGAALFWIVMQTRPLRPRPLLERKPR